MQTREFLKPLTGFGNCWRNGNNWTSWIVASCCIKRTTRRLAQKLRLPTTSDCEPLRRPSEPTFTQRATVRQSRPLSQLARRRKKKWIWKLRLSAKLDNKLQFYLQTATCSRATKLALATTSNGRRPLPLCLACKLHCLLVDASCKLQLANRASITHTICRGNGNPITTTTTMEPDFCCFRARSKQLATKATQIVNGHVAKSRKIA